MTFVYVFAARAAFAAAYVILAVANMDAARDLAFPFGMIVLMVALWDIFGSKLHRGATEHEIAADLGGPALPPDGAPPGKERRGTVDVRYSSFAKRISAVISGMVVWLLLIGGLSLYLLDENGDRSADNERLIEQVQEQRRASIETSCEETNARNVAVIAQVGSSSLPAEAQRTTIALVNALVPYVKDCEARADSRVPR